MLLRASRAGGGIADPAPESGPPGRGLTLDQRGQIQAGLRTGLRVAAIGRLIGRNRSVVHREIIRNTSPDGIYYASVANTKAHQRRRRPKPVKLAANPTLASQIEGWMDQGWSPKLMAHALAEDHPGDQTWRVSHETIYRALYVQTRGTLRQDLARQLSTSRTKRVPQQGRTRRAALYRDAFRIAQRPPEVADRAVPGHWEGDLIVGSKGSAIGTLVERTTRFVLLLHLPTDHTAATVASAMIAAMGQLPEHLRKSITWDRGSELAHYERIQLELDTTVFFADPHSPWQRGSNENTNRLLRHWFTKGTDLRDHGPEDLARAQASLNARPRPTLNYDTPAKRLATLLNAA